MKNYTRREFIRLGVASTLFAGLSSSGCINVQGERFNKNFKNTPLIRNQPEGVGHRLRIDLKALDDLVQVFNLMMEERLHSGAQLAVYRHGELVIELAGGKDLPSGKPITEKTLFQIRSITKALSAMVMLMLHDRGRFNFKDTVSKHWPEFGKKGKETITIAQIMSHRAVGLDIFEFEGDRIRLKWANPYGEGMRVFEIRQKNHEPVRRGIKG